MRLVYTDTKQEVQVGDFVTLRDGFVVRIVEIKKPAHPGSTGRVVVCEADRLPTDKRPRFRGVDTDITAEYYPSVIGASWIEREDRMTKKGTGLLRLRRGPSSAKTKGKDH